MITIEEYAREVQKQDQLQQQYFALRRAGKFDGDLLKRSKEQEAKVRNLTKFILNPEPQLFRERLELENTEFDFGHDVKHSNQ